MLRSCERVGLESRSTSRVCTVNVGTHVKSLVSAPMGKEALAIVQPLVSAGTNCKAAK